MFGPGGTELDRGRARNRLDVRSGQRRRHKVPTDFWSTGVTRRDTSVSSNNLSVIDID